MLDYTLRAIFVDPLIIRSSIGGCAKNNKCIDISKEHVSSCSYFRPETHARNYVLLRQGHLHIELAGFLGIVCEERRALPVASLLHEQCACARPHMEPLLGATSEAYDNSVAVQLHRYGDSTAIPEALDSHAAPLWITDTPNRSHTASEATPSALTLLPRARLYAALAIFTAIATMYATVVLSTHWFRPHRRSVQILASLQAAPVLAALAAEGLLQSGMLPNAKHCNGQLGRCEFNRCI